MKLQVEQRTENNEETQVDYKELPDLVIEA
jgi:hypothetical protein